MIGGTKSMKSLITLTRSRQTHFISQLGTVLYRNYMVPGRQGSAANEIQKIIESVWGRVFPMVIWPAFRMGQ